MVEVRDVLAPLEWRQLDVGEASELLEFLGILNARFVVVKTDVDLLEPATKFTDGSLAHGESLALDVDTRNGGIAPQAYCILEGRAYNNLAAFRRDFAPQANDRAIVVGNPLVLLGVGRIDFLGGAALLMFNKDIAEAWGSKCELTAILEDDFMGDGIDLAIFKKVYVASIRLPIVNIILLPRSDLDLYL